LSNYQIILLNIFKTNRRRPQWLEWQPSSRYDGLATVELAWIFNQMLTGLKTDWLINGLPEKKFVREAEEEGVVAAAAAVEGRGLATKWVARMLLLLSNKLGKPAGLDCSSTSGHRKCRTVLLKF